MNVVVCSNNSEITHSQVILLNILWQPQPEYLHLRSSWRAAPQRSHFVASVADFNVPWTTCRLQLPMLTKLFNPVSSLSFFISQRTLQFTLGPSIANLIFLDKSKPANLPFIFCSKSGTVSCPRKIESQ